MRKEKQEKQRREGDREGVSSIGCDEWDEHRETKGQSERHGGANGASSMPPKPARAN